MKNLKGLKIASLNINIIIEHINELKVLMESNPIDILAINESKIDDTVSDNEIHINGYNIIRNDRNRNGGGVLMYIRKPLSFSERNDLVPDLLEIICVEIKNLHNKSFVYAHGIGRQVRILTCLIILKLFSINVVLLIRSF